MKEFWTDIKSKWSLLAVFATGALSFGFLPNKTFDGATQELIALFGLLMAGVLPTMVLTASVLRAGNLSVRTLIQYRDALRGQMLIWIGLFLVSLFASLLVVLGKITHWSIVLVIPLSWTELPDFHMEVISLLNALIVMALSLVVFRAVAVGNGVLSLLRLSAELAISEAQLREQGKHEAAEIAIASMPKRSDFGKYVKVQR